MTVFAPCRKKTEKIGAEKIGAEKSVKFSVWNTIPMGIVVIPFVLEISEYRYNTVKYKPQV